MRTALLVALVLALPMSVMADAFAPTQMTLSGEASVYYEFNSSELSIPVTVTGTPARVIFSVYTKGKADEISRIRNGYLGWHYVDAIDTCVYFSPAYDFQIGTGAVTWSGQTHNTYLQEGNTGPIGAGDYTYYLWGYDNINPRIFATAAVSTLNRQNAMIYDQAPDGTPLDRPFVCGKVDENPDGDGPLLWTWWTQYKWLIGNDPLNTDLVETCFFGDYKGGQWEVFSGGWGNVAWDNADFEYCYHKRDSKVNQRATVWKLQWVPNGNAVQDETWGEDLVWDAKIYLSSGMSTDGTYLYTFTHDLFEKVEMSSRAYIIDKDAGEMLYDFYHQDWTDFAQFAIGADYLNGGGPTYHQMRNGYLFGANFLCIKQMCDPYRYMETEDYQDYKRWSNTNGDWVSDFNWQPDAVYKWACFGESPPKNRSFDPDNLNWVLNMVGQFGAVSFDLFGPDGTGIGYFGLQGDAERASGSAMTVDSGSAYDGMYVDLLAGRGYYYVAWDSFMGTITDTEIGVADAAPAAFAVAQNSPNPFNPTTTINFTIPEAGRVNVDVFNVAGQKVNTLVNDSMEAGSHTVTFDGANLAAGVYFYTVKAGEFSKTMKMTLLK